MVQTRVYLKDFTHYAEMNEIYGNYFTDEVGKPARTSCQVGALAHGAQIEIEAVAALKSRCCVFVVNKLKIWSAVYWGLNVSVFFFISREESGITIKAIGTQTGRAYSTAVTVNQGLTFVSGQIGYDKEAGGVIQGGFQAEARESMKNLEDVLV